MFVSTRFTNTVTAATHSRLEKVLDNSRPITRRERSRGAVVAIQAALSDLNQGYLVPAEVDGRFGTNTARAVEAFQRDYGLVADGVVGRQTLTELDHLYSGDLFREPFGMSVHVGVNVVDAAHYGSDYPLSACVNDANDFRDLASNLGYETVLLADQEATTANFVAALRQAATNLFSGDSLFVTFSGHGSQLVNTSPNDEVDDGMDETLCFYDRMLVDDEVYALLADVRPGVNVTMLYDSCHSATVTRFLIVGGRDPIEADLDATRDLLVRSMTRRVTSFDPDVDDVRQDDAAAEHRFVPFASDDLLKALDGDRAEQIAQEPLSEARLVEIADAVVGTIRDLETSSTRFIALREVNGIGGIYERNRSLYDAVRSVVGVKAQDDLDCHVVALSACQDNQTTLDGTVNGFYTGNVLGVWHDGDFDGSVRQLHERLKAESSSNITPALHTYGGPRAGARLEQRPFTF